MWKSMLIVGVAFALFILLGVGTVYLAPVCAPMDHTGIRVGNMLMGGCK